MNNQVVVDTNVLVALQGSRDKWHRSAKNLIASFEARQMSVIYLDCVVNETISVLARRAEKQKRADQFPALLDELMQQAPKDTNTWVSAEVKRLYPEIVGLVSGLVIPRQLFAEMSVNGENNSLPLPMRLTSL